MQTFFTIVAAALLASVAVMLLDPADPVSGSSEIMAEEVTAPSDQG